MPEKKKKGGTRYFVTNHPFYYAPGKKEKGGDGPRKETSLMECPKPKNRRGGGG